MGLISPNLQEAGTFKESVRYRYKEKISTTASPSGDAQLRGARIEEARDEVKVATCTRNRPEVFAAMTPLLCRRVADMPDSSYLLHAGSSQFDGGVRAMMGGLKTGHLDSIEFFDADRFRVAPIERSASTLDGVWDFDWSQPSRWMGRPAKAGFWPKAEFDRRTSSS